MQAERSVGAGMSLVQVKGLSRAFGSRRAVRDVSFNLAGGECLAVFGPNGAGKTTLLRLLAGLLRPGSGECIVAGRIIGATPAARSAVGLISHASMLYSALTAFENVLFSARLHGVADATEKTRSALLSMNILDRATAPVRSLSRGLQQRVSIARAIVHAPSLLLCDEPYTGLDEIGSAALTALLAARREAGAALLVVTHNIAEGLALATHSAIMREGAFVRYSDAAPLNAEAYAADYRAVLADA